MAHQTITQRVPALVPSGRYHSLSDPVATERMFQFFIREIYTLCPSIE